MNAKLTFAKLKRRLAGAASRSLIRLRIPTHRMASDLMIRELIGERRTMVSAVRLRNLRDVSMSPGLPPGSMVECGVARGGCLALMAYAAPARAVWGFDSFEGMPPLTAEDGGDGEQWVGYRCSGPNGKAEAEATLRRFGVENSSLRLVTGWFEDTLPTHVAAIGPIAVLRLDNDWYRSTRFCLETLYDAVVPGGVVLIDDYYSFAGCRLAVDEFRSARGVRNAVVDVEPEAEVCWRKGE